MARHRDGINRREVLRTALRAACGGGLAVLLISLPARRSAAAIHLRPPGALSEDRFLAACVRCGLCVRACPYDTLTLQGTDPAMSPGTPTFVARAVACEMCETIPCVVACPTGALDKGLNDIKAARMGTAVLVGHETCLNLLGLRCDVCYRVCPLTDSAITLEPRHNPRTGRHAIFIPTVHTDRCTGCGKCEKACVLDEAAIKVLPAMVAVGELGHHYRLGWEEKKKAGEALIEGTIELPIRGMEGGLPPPAGEIGR